MPAVGDRVSPVGPWTGAQGPQGDPGPAGGFPDPAADINGRNSGGVWVPSLPLAGGEMSGAINISGFNALSLYNPGYNIRIDTQTGTSGLAFNSNVVHQFWSGGGQCQSFQAESIYFQTDGWRLQHIGGDQVIYYNNASQAQFGWWGGNVTSWGNAYTTSYMQGQSFFITYANITTGGFQFQWNNGMVFGQWNNNPSGTGSVGYYLANACDMRLKQDIKPSRFDCLGALRRMRLYQFRWRAKGDVAPLVPVGFVAQRLDEDFPETVMRSGVALPDPENYAPLGIEPNVMLAALVGAVQQLDRDIAELEDAPARSDHRRHLNARSVAEGSQPDG